MRIYDTLTASLKELVPLTDEVRMYVCGLTPYSEAHVGHAMKAVVFDTLRRYLEWSGQTVRHIENFTDIEDKLIERSQSLGDSVTAIAEKHAATYLDGLAKLNVLPASSFPRATAHMDDIIDLIRRLAEAGLAYASGGDVYYRVRRFEGYGKLSKRNVDDLLSGARIEPGELKEDPLDFALWKGAKPGEPAWDSPWGQGRPGWHIECSAMAIALLGDTIDIHGGGADLIFPHHENEIAQSEGATGAPFANIWMHNALLQLEDDKMSKSLGNIVSLSEAVERWDGDTLRLFFLGSHYRSPLTWSEEAIEAAGAGADRLRNAAHATSTPGTAVVASDDARRRFTEAMDDDLNTAQAIAVLFDLSREINRGRDTGYDATAAQATLKELAGVLGLRLELRSTTSDAAPFIDLLVELRRELRTAKQYALADVVRDRLAALNIEVRDSAEGTDWVWRR